MDDKPQQFQRGTYTVTTDRRQINLPAALALLHGTSWGAGMTLAVLGRASANSVCFGLHEGPLLIGFARAVTDLATFAYLTDVVIDEARRGQGLGRWLIECVLTHPDLQNLRPHFSSDGRCPGTLFAVWVPDRLRHKNLSGAWRQWLKNKSVLLAVMHQI